MLCTAKRFKVEEVSVNMSSLTGGSVCIKLEGTAEMPMPYYFLVGEEKDLKKLEQRLKIDSIYGLTGKSVIAFVHDTYIFEIVYDDESENAVNKAARRMTITSAVIDNNTEALKVKAKADDGEETIEYCFEKGSYSVKVFLLEMDVIDANDLTGRSIIAYMEGDNVLRISRDIWQ